ncbi:CAP domain-containing protein [Actinokineospora sp. HUAS TT18]|uniref:CAP domain-containing protein n=1 Tax=Actinokineospora sp. HUAS TT18 TaxID=3447451 RepID=UPI003F5250C2
MHYTPKPQRRRRGLLIAVCVAVAAVAVVVALPTWRDPASVAIVDSPSDGARSDTESSITPDPARSASATVADAGAASTAPTTTVTTTTAAPPPPPPTTTTTKPKPTTTKPKPAPVPAGTDPAESEVLTIVNAERSKAGCGPLRWHDTLALAARKHSADMAANNYFDHESLDGRSPFDRMKAEGYAKGGGENIAAGQSTPKSVMESWMNSPGHRANILNCDFKELGVGMAKGGSYRIYWTQAFGYA